MDKDHKFTKSIVEDEDDRSRNQREDDLVSRFSWDETDEEMSSVDQPELEPLNAIEECIEVIMDHVCKSLKVEYVTLGEDDVPLKMYIPVDESIHRLLSDRYDTKWTEDSRIAVFDFITCTFAREWDRDLKTIDGCRSLIEKAFDEMFPFQGNKRHHIDSVQLWEGTSQGFIPESKIGLDQIFGVEIKASYVAKD